MGGVLLLCSLGFILGSISIIKKRFVLRARPVGFGQVGVKFVASHRKFKRSEREKERASVAAAHNCRPDDAM